MTVPQTGRRCAAQPPTKIHSKRKPPIKTRRADFDALVTRYYSTVYNFASHLTDDPREAVLLTHAAFNSVRGHLPTRRNQATLVIILLNAVIRGGFSAT
jgi:hypothetical protein